MAKLLAAMTLAVALIGGAVVICRALAKQDKESMDEEGFDER